MRWLKTLGLITWDCKDLTMEFLKGRQRIKLKGYLETKNQWPQDDKQQAQLKELHTYCIQVVPWQAEAHCCALHLEERERLTIRL